MSKIIRNAVVAVVLTLGAVAVSADWKGLAAAVVGHASDVVGQVVALGPLVEDVG